MVSSSFEQVAAKLIEHVAAGATFNEACRVEHVNVDTGRTWLRKGRAASEGQYAAFAASISAAQQAQAVPAFGETMTRSEWELCLASAVRAGSIPAMKLWHETHPVEPNASDPFSEFDDLAERRRNGLQNG